MATQNKSQSLTQPWDKTVVATHRLTAIQLGTS